MKKSLITLALLFIAPSLMAATADSALPTAPDNNAQWQPHIQFPNQQAPSQQQDGMSLSSSEFGWSGPVSFTTTYSATYGWMLSGQYTQGLGERNAISLLLTGGAEQQRANFTWGLAFAQQQRIKLTGEYLRQKMDFDFSAGDVKKWEGQQAYGADYQYVIPHSWLNAVDLDVNYSDAQTRNLNTVLYDDNTMENFRRIAGGRDFGTSAGVNIVPNAATSFNLAANYDDVKYNTKYENHQNLSGFGATLNLQHLLTQRVKWQLLASQKIPVSSYGTELDYLIPTASGTRLELNTNVDRDLGKGRLANDFRVSAGVNYLWGGNPHGDRDQTYVLDSVDSMSDLNTWTAAPAVERPEVLAVVDQKSVAVDNVQQHGNMFGLAGSPCALHEPYATNYKIPDTEIETNQSVGNIVLGMVDDPAPNLLFNNVDYEIFPTIGVSAKNLPAGLAVSLNGNKQIILSGKTSAALPAKGVDVSLYTTVKVAGVNYTTCEAGAQHVVLKPGNPSITLSPTSPWKINEGQAGTSSKPFGTADISAGEGTIKTITIKNESELAKYGLTDNKASLIGKQAGDLKFTGTAGVIPTTGIETADITMTNSTGKSVTAPLTIQSYGLPLHSGDPNAVTAAESTRIHSVAFSYYFSRANNISQKPTSYTLTATGPDSKTIQPSALNLTFDATTGVLSQNATKNIPEDDLGIYTFAVKATNDVGTSKEAAIFHLTLQAGPNPLITPTGSVLYLTKGETATDANSEFATINAHGAGTTVTNDAVTFNPAFSHGVTVALKQTQAPSITQPAEYEAHFTGTVTNQTLSDTPEKYTVSATNSIGKTGTTATDAVEIAVLGPPVRGAATASGGSLMRGQAVDVAFPAFNNYFSDQTGAMHYYLCPSNSFSKTNCIAEGQAGSAATFDLGINSSAHIVGTLLLSAAEGAHQLYIFATNDKGGPGSVEAVSDSSTEFDFTVPATQLLRCPLASDGAAITNYTMTAIGPGGQTSFDFEGRHFVDDKRGIPRSFFDQNATDANFKFATLETTDTTLDCQYSIINEDHFRAGNLPNPQPVGPYWRGSAPAPQYCGGAIGHQPVTNCQVSTQ